MRITDDVQVAVDEAGIAEGMALVSAMHITAGVWVNDDEPGLHADTLEWLDKLRPRAGRARIRGGAGAPPTRDTATTAGGEDNGDAHLKSSSSITRRPSR